MIYLFVGLIGASLGSFAGALAWRLRTKRDFVHERSVCEHCKHILAWYDLLPVISWVSLRGKCRYCKKPIAGGLPIIELLGAAAAVAAYMVIEDGTTESLGLLAVWLPALAILLTLIVYDVRWMMLPDKLLRPLAMFVAIHVVADSIVYEANIIEVVWFIATGAAVGGGFFYLLFQLSQGRWIGGGDVKLGFVMGALLGPLNALVGLLMAFYLAAIYILPLMAIGKISRKSKIPFGPFLVIGFILAFLWGDAIRESYLSITGY